MKEKKVTSKYSSMVSISSYCISFSSIIVVESNRGKSKHDPSTYNNMNKCEDEQQKSISNFNVRKQNRNYILHNGNEIECEHRTELAQSVCLQQNISLFLCRNTTHRTVNRFERRKKAEQHYIHKCTQTYANNIQYNSFINHFICS